MSKAKPGATVRCLCGRLAKTTYPCKSCGRVRHIVAITKIKWQTPESPDLTEMLRRGARAAMEQWYQQAGLPFDGEPSLLPENQPIERVTLIFDFDLDDLVITFYTRTQGMKYPPGQPT